jgi:hypothetical protein
VPSATAFKPTDEIEKPFAQFSTIGAEMTDGIDFADWSRVTNFLINSDFGLSGDSVHSVDRAESADDSDSKIVATAGVLSSNKRRVLDVERPFDKQPPPGFGELIELVRCLPPHHSLAFRLLHPLIVGIEMGGWPINFEKGVISNDKFRHLFNALFEKSSTEIDNDRRIGIKGWGHLSVFSCAFWQERGIGISNDAEYLAGEFWRLVLKKDYAAYNALSFEQQIKFEHAEENFEALLEVTCRTTKVNGREIDLDLRLITLDRGFRFGLPPKLINYLIGKNPLACSTRMADLYESFYILHDIAYMTSNGYREATISKRSVRDDLALLINDTGQVRICKSLFWDLVREESIRAAQIRACKLRNCRRIFWAKAKNQVCCTSQCANLYEAHKKRYPTPEAQAAYIERWNQREQKRLRRRPHIITGK